MHRFVFKDRESPLDGQTPLSRIINTSGKVEMHGWGGGISGLQHLVRGETQAAVGLDMPQAALDSDTAHGVSVLESASHQSKFVNPHEYRMFMAHCRADSPHDQIQKNLWKEYIHLKKQTLAWLAKLPKTSPRGLKQHTQNDADTLFQVTECPVPSALPAHFVVEEAFGRNPITPPTSTAQPKSNQQYKVLVLTPKDQTGLVLGAFKIQTNTKSAHDGSEIEHGDEIGVNIECQDLGLGSILLREALRKCEKDTFEINASVDPGLLSLYVQQFGGQVVDLTRRLQGDGTYITKYRIRFDAKKSSQINLQEKEKLGAGFSTLNATRLQSLASQLTDLNLVWEPIHHWEPNQSSTPNIQEAIRRIEQSLQSLGDQDTYIVSCPTPLTRPLELVLCLTSQHLLKTHIIDGYTTEGTEMVYHFRKKPGTDMSDDTARAADRYMRMGRLPSQEEQARLNHLRDYRMGYSDIHTIHTNKTHYHDVFPHKRVHQKYTSILDMPEQERIIPPDAFHVYVINLSDSRPLVKYYEYPIAEMSAFKLTPCATSTDISSLDSITMPIYQLIDQLDRPYITGQCAREMFVIGRREGGRVMYDLHINWRAIERQISDACGYTQQQGVGIIQKIHTYAYELGLR